VAYEPQQQFLDRGRDRIEKSISKLVAKNKVTKEVADQTLGSIEYTTDLTKLHDTDLIVEAIIEDMALKEKLYTELGRICQAETIFASNTSSLSIAEMASFSGRSEKFVGVHFFNPVQVSTSIHVLHSIECVSCSRLHFLLYKQVSHTFCTFVCCKNFIVYFTQKIKIMKLVEVIRTDQTDPAVFEKTKAWVSSIGKVAVSCRDTPGFIVNRLLVPFMMNAMLMVDRNDASVPDIDVSMQLGASHPMGPLHLTDYIGLDTALSIVQGWVTKYPNEPTFIVPQCLKAKVAAGELGRKTGKGFYHWDGDKRGDPVD
jgi:3-hydroxyacyl-CoA dehydrogenase